MKTKKFFVLSALVLCMLSLSSFKSTENSITEIVETVDQDGLIVYAKFDGKEDYGYNFVVKKKNDEEHTLTFQKISDSVLKNFDLNAETFIGTSFKITFKKELKVSKDADGVEDEDETNTITQLEKL